MEKTPARATTVLMALLACASALHVVNADMEQVTDDFGEAVLLEDFDTGHVVLSAPDSLEYDHTVNGGTFSSVVQSSTSQSAPNAWRSRRVSGTNPHDLLDFSASGALDICSGANIDFWVRVDGGAMTFGIGDAFLGTSTAAIYFTLQVGGVLRANVDASGSVVTGDIIASPNFLANTWYHVRVSDMNCATATATFSELTTENSVTVVGSGNLNAFDTDNSHDKVGFLSNSGDNAYLDNLKLPMNADAVIGSAATAAVTDLVGFDVDFEGNNAIARTENGANVRVFNAQDLTLAGGPVDTDCAQFDGVTTGATNVAYLNCNVSGDVTSFEIRSPTFGDPSVPDACSGSVDELKTWDVSGAETQVETYDLLSVDFETSQALESVCTIFVILATTREDGKVAIHQLKRVPPFNNAEEQYSNLVQYAPLNSLVDQVCPAFGSDTLNFAEVLAQDSTAEIDFYVVAVDGSSQTKAYHVDDVLGDPRLTLVSTIGGDLGMAKGVGCGFSDHALVQGASFLASFNYTAGSVDWQVANVAGSDKRTVALSADGLWAAALFGADVKVLNATSGAVLGTITPPAGTWREIRMDSTGQNVWVATSTTIARYDVHLVTTVTSKSTNLRDPIVDAVNNPPETGGGGGVGGGVLNLPRKTSLIASAVTVFAFLAIGYRFTAGNRGDRPPEE